MLDLDAVTLQVRLVQDDQDQSTLAWKLATSTLPKVLAELRAAREVRDEVDRLYEDDRIHLGEDERLLRLLAAWDQATKEST